MPVLDTSLLIDLERGRPEAEMALHRLVEDDAPLLVAAQAAVEYLLGIEDSVQALHVLDRSFVVVPFGRAHIHEAARIGQAARLRGHPPAWGDLQIAALAVLEDTYVVTADTRHFTQLAVPVWDYRKDDAPPAEAQVS